MPVPQKYYEALQNAYGKDGAVEAGAFNLGFDDFKQKLQNQQYAQKIYNALDNAYGTKGKLEQDAFTLPFNDFYSKLNPPKIEQTPQIDYNKIISDTRGLQDEQQLNEQSKQGTKIQAMTAPGGFVPVNNTPTPADIERGNKLNANIASLSKLWGVPEADVNKTLKDFPFTNNADQLKQFTDLRNTNPYQYQRQIGAHNWQIPLVEAIRKRATPDEAKGIIDNLVQQQANPNKTFPQAQEQLKENIGLVRQYVDDSKKQDEIIANLKKDAAINYGGKIAGTNEYLQSLPEAAYLNNNQLLGLQFLKDTEPETAKSYDMLRANPNNLTTFEQQLGFEEKAKQLDELGANLRINQLGENIYKLEAKEKNDGLTQQEQQELSDDIVNYNSVNDYVQDFGIKYPKATNLDALTTAQELVGQRTGLMKNFLLNTGSATENTIQGVRDIVSMPFRSDNEENNRQQQLQAYGDKGLQDYSTYTTQENSLLQNFETRVSPALKQQIDEIKNDKSLTDDEKLTKTAQLLQQNRKEWYKQPIDSRINVTAKSLLTGTGHAISQILPFIASTAATGGFGNLSKAQKALSVFGSAYATGYEEAYKDALKENIPNPEGYAARVTAINSAAMVVGDNVGAIKRILSPRTAIGEMVNKMSDAEIAEIVKKSPSIFKGAIKAATNSLKEGTVSAAQMTAAGMSGKIINDMLSGKIQSAEEYGKQFAVQMLSQIPFGFAGLKHQLDNVNNMQKMSLFEAASKPEEFKLSVDNMVRNGNLTPVKAEEIKNNIDAVAKIYQKTDFISNKGEPLTDEQKADLLLNKVKEDRLKEDVKNAPEGKKEKLQEKLDEVKQDINDNYVTPNKPKVRISADQAEEINKKQLAEKGVTPQPEPENAGVAENAAPVIEVPKEENTNTVPSLESKKEDIERRRNEELDAVPLVPVTDEVKSKEKEGKENKINAKYDAELKALEDESKKATELPKPKEKTSVTNESPNPVEQPAEGQPEQAEQPIIENKQKIGVRHVETEALRTKRGIEEYQRTPETMDEWEAQADEKIKNGYDVEDLVDRMDKGYLPDKVEQRIMERYLNALDAELEASPTVENLAKLRRATQISDKVGGSEVAKSLSSRQNRNADNSTLGGFLLEKEEAQAHPLTETQLKEQTEKFNELKRAKDELQIELDKAKARIAELELKKGGKSKTKKTHEEYVKERKDIVQQMREDLLKVAKGGEGVMSSIPYAAQLKAIAPHIAKLVKSLVNEGYDKLEDVAKFIHDEVKPLIPEITNSDVLDLINGEHIERQPTRNEKAETLRNLKAEATLLRRIEKAMKGEEPATEKGKIEKSRRIQELEERLKEVKQFNKLKDSEPIEELPIELTPEERLKKEHQRLDKRIEKLEDDIKNKRYAEEEPVKPEIKLDAEGRKKLDRVIELEKQRKIEIERDRYEKLPKWQKNWDKVVQALGIRRIVQTAIDLSVTLRQGVTVMANPRNWWNGVAGKAFMAQVKSVFSPKRFDRIMHAIRNSEDYHEMEKDGIVFNEIDMADPLKTNEDFQKSWVYKVPYLKEPLLASNRAADGFLNVSRYELYQNGKRILERQGITRENSPQEYKDMAKWIMNITGRGTFKEGMEKSGFVKRLLNNTFFGARLMASRFNILNPVYYAKMSKQARVEAFKDMAGVTTTLVATTLALMAAGGKTSLNPNDPEFLKVRFGNNVYDLTGGLGNYIRTYLRILELAYSRGSQAMGGATKHEVNEDLKRAGNSSTTFVRSKLAPNTSYVAGALTGKDAIGQDFNPYDALKIYPMYVDDIKDAWKDEGVTSLATVLIPSIFGLGVQHYEPKDTPEDLPTLLKRNMRTDEQDMSKISTYDNGVERPITRAEFDNYIKVRDGKIKQGIEDMYKNGAPEIRDGKAVIVPYPELTKDEIVAETTRIKTAATKEAKDELFPVPENILDQKENNKADIQELRPEK